MGDVKIVGWFDSESQTLWEFKPKSVVPNAEAVVLKSDYDATQSELAALREELATLRESYESMRDRKNSIVDLQQRLTAAEQRNAILTKALIDIRENSDDPGAYECASEALGSTGKDTDIKPTESGASE